MIGLLRRDRELLEKAVAAHQAALDWVLYAQIRAFFDSINHDWMMRFLEHRIGDRRVFLADSHWLRAGVMDEGGR